VINIEDLTLTIEGVEFVGKDLDAQGQELLRHIIDVRDRTYQLRFELAQLDVLNTAFTEALRNTASKRETA